MSTCGTCGGTRLPPARIGAERGTCHCHRPGRIHPHSPVGQSTWYEVEFNGVMHPVDPRTSLTAAYVLLEQLRQSDNQ